MEQDKILKVDELEDVSQVNDRIKEGWILLNTRTGKDETSFWTVFTLGWPESKGDPPRLPDLSDVTFTTRDED